MEALRRYLKPLYLLLLLPAGLALAIAAHPFTEAETKSDSFSATYSHGALSLAIPYHAERGDPGRLVVEILDPEDQVLGHAERNLDTAKGDGSWKLEITPVKPLALEDLVWERVHYRFEYSSEKTAAFEETKSVSEILRQPVVHIVGQTSYISGGEAAVRVVVTDSDYQMIAGRSSVRIELLVPDHAARVLFTGQLNQRGTTEAQFHFPAGVTGNYQLHYVAETPIGATEFTQPVRLEDKASILLTTEKPIYQPGQTIHVRALALDRADHHAEADRKLTFEVEDSRGNKVFKKATQTDAFGIASAEFVLADEVNLGMYHLRALMGDGDTPANTAEVALNVERYVLPKFKVAVDFDKKDNKVKRDYRPGDHVTGTIQANYFFGKPVDHAEIAIKASSMDVSLFEADAANGKTDKDGSYHFDLKLPSYFAGRPLSQGAARVLIEATVKDSAAHSETRGEPITVSQSPLLITAVPEGGKLIPHLENQVFVLTSYPDSTPANTALAVHIAGERDQQVVTDNGGVAVVHVKPGDGGETLKVDADDHHGNRTSSDVPLETRGGAEQILLRTERAVYKAGDRIELNVFSTQERGTAYVDIVKEGQTVLTRDVDIVNGRAELAVTATPEMSGTLDFDAYLFGRDAQPIGDHRLVFVQPADELKIETVADAQSYKPGSEARVRFHVTNSHGQGVSAALGLQVVDEAVFALAEKQPGFAKVFFYLEQEVMKPRYEIHSLSMNDIAEPVGESQIEQHDRAARALFSATEMAHPNKLDTEFGRSLPQEKQADYRERYRAAFVEHVQHLADKFSKAYGQTPADDDFPKLFAKMTNADGAKPRDAWGTELQVESFGWTGTTRYYRIASAGPDQQFHTSDDLAVYVEVHSGNVVRSPAENGGTIDVRIEHDQGPFNGRAEITGTVTDPTRAVIPRAHISLRMGANVRRAVANAAGQFTLSAVPAGKYTVEITSNGFQTATRNFSVEPRDRAVLSSTLNVGSSAQTVMVDAGSVENLPVNGRDRRQLQVMAEGFMVQDAVVMAAPPKAQMGRFQGGIAGGAGSGLLLRKEARSSASTETKDEGADAPHVRSYFPEALYINPEIVTDGNGVASITIPMADSITTWRMAMLASTKNGALGTSSSSLKVFQDFFVDLDLPVTLTQGDRVSIPVAIYNYAGERGDVSLKLQPEDWFSLVNDDSEKHVAVDAGKVGGSQFTLEAKRIGKFKLTLAAKLRGSAHREDIVVREIEVIPNGREQSIVYNGRLDSTVQHEVKFPATSIPDASKLFVRLYPGPLSQVIEGMDSLLRMPYGCFEQTSSSTYPNVLALDYMKRTKKLTPEVHAKAEGYIANGYQRLLTFEVPGGGFSWFGQAPANKILTAYGLMEFSDMSKVYDVDPRLIERTRDWLVRQQQPDGSWKPDTSFINEGATNRYNSDVLRITAYIAWSLENTGDQEPAQGPAVEKAKQYIESHLDKKIDTYTLAVLANFAADYGKDRDFTQQVMHLLLDARTEKDDQVSWNAEETSVYSTGSSAAVETTGLAVQALLKWGQASETTRKALNYITSKKEASGTWGTTQATIMALRALLLASERGTADTHGVVEISLNGKVVEKLQLTPENNDLFHQFVLQGIHESEGNTVQLRFTGSGGLAYQVVGRYFVPWDEKPENEALSIDVTYDRTKLAQNDIATTTATVKNNLNKTANMVMVDLGIPPGFDLLSEDLQEFQEKSAQARNGRLEKFSLTATQAILYFDSLAPHQTVTLHFRLRAKYPIRAHTFQSKVYEYYDPAVNSIARPVQFEVGTR